MAPVPTHSPPGLGDFIAHSPRIFWVVFAVLVLAFLLLVGFGLHKLVTYNRKKAVDRSSWPSYIEKSILRSLVLPRILRDHDSEKRAWMRWGSRKKPLTSGGRSGSHFYWITSLWNSLLFKKECITSPSRSTISPSRSISPSSKAWIAEHEHYWDLQRDMIQAGRPICAGELLPWVPYIPFKSTASTIPDVDPITVPFPVFFKHGVRDRSSFARATENVSRSPVLSIIQEDEGEVILAALASLFTEESLSTNESTGSSDEGSIPSIVIEACHELSPPVDKHADIKLSLFEVRESGVDYLRAPDDDEEPGSPKPTLRNVSRPKWAGRFTAVPPTAPKRDPAVSSRLRANFPPPGWF